LPLWLLGFWYVWKALLAPAPTLGITAGAAAEGRQARTDQSLMLMASWSV
jgi:hypothetical protein